MNSSDTRCLERFYLKFTSIATSDNFNLQLSLTERRVFHTALQDIFKIVNSPYLHDIFSFAVDVTGRSGRDQHRLFVPRVYTDYGRWSLAYSGTTIWKRLSPKKL